MCLQDLAWIAWWSLGDILKLRVDCMESSFHNNHNKDFNTVLISTELISLAALKYLQIIQINNDM